MFITGNIFHFTQIEKFLPDTPQMRISTNKISIPAPEESLDWTPPVRNGPSST